MKQEKPFTLVLLVKSDKNRCLTGFCTLFCPSLSISLLQSYKTEKLSKTEIMMR